MQYTPFSFFNSIMDTQEIDWDPDWQDSIEKRQEDILRRPKGIGALRDFCTSDEDEYYEGVTPWGDEVRFYPGYDIYGEIEPIDKVYGGG